MAGDGVQMDVSGVTQAMSQLAEAGSTFHSEWSAATAQGMGGLGQGPMGAAFAGGFQPGADKLHQAASQIAGHIGDTAQAGNVSAADYQNADAAAGSAFPK